MTPLEALQDLLHSGPPYTVKFAPQPLDPAILAAPRPKSLKGLRTKKLTPEVLQSLWLMGMNMDADGSGTRLIGQKYDPKTGATAFKFEVP